MSSTVTGRNAISAGFALPRGPHRENWPPAGGWRSEADLIARLRDDPERG